MASDQFIIEMHRKLHPRSKKTNCEELTGDQVNEILALVEKKHAITIGSDALGESITVDLNTMLNIMTSASLAATAGMRKQEEMKIGDIQNIGGGWDKEAMKDWMVNYQYYLEQKQAVDRIEEQILNALRDKTNEEDFYLS
jgi:ABC-type lipoprotein release transport system permease subunit